MHLLSTAVSIFGAALAGRPLSSDALKLGIGVVLSSTVDSFPGFERLLAVFSVLTTVGLTIVADTQYPAFGFQAPQPYGHPLLYIPKATRTTPLATTPSATIASADSTNVGLWIAGIILAIVGSSGTALIRYRGQEHDHAVRRLSFIVERPCSCLGIDYGANDTNLLDIFSEHSGYDGNDGSDYVDEEEAIYFGSDDDGDGDNDLDASGDILPMDSSAEDFPVTPPRRLVPRGEPDWTPSDERRAIAYVNRHTLMAGDSPTPGGLQNISPSPIFTKILPPNFITTNRPQVPSSKIPVRRVTRPSFQLDLEEDNPFAPEKSIKLSGQPCFRMCSIDDTIHANGSSSSVF